MPAYILDHVEQLLSESFVVRLHCGIACAAATLLTVGKLCRNDAGVIFPLIRLYFVAVAVVKHNCRVKPSRSIK